MMHRWWQWHCNIGKCACMYHFVLIKDSCWLLLLCYLNHIVTSQFESILEKWTSLDVENIVVLFFVFWVFSKLIKPYHSCVYIGFQHICLCINANKNDWLVLFGMMVILLGKNIHKLLCYGCTRAKVMVSFYFLFESAQLRPILCCGFCIKKFQYQW